MRALPVAALVWLMAMGAACYDDATRARLTPVSGADVARLERAIADQARQIDDLKGQVGELEHRLAERGAR